MYGDEATIRRILTELGDTWAVVGLSSNRGRAAYGVAQVLQRFGKRIVPVHPKAETVHGERGYASLADIPFDVDVVDVFVNGDLAGAGGGRGRDEGGTGGVVPAGRRRRGRLPAHPDGGPGDGHEPVPGDRNSSPDTVTLLLHHNCPLNIDIRPAPLTCVKADPKTDKIPGQVLGNSLLLTRSDFLACGLIAR